MFLGAYVGIALITALIVFIAGRNRRGSGVSCSCCVYTAVIAGTTWPLMILGVAELLLAYLAGEVSRRI